MTEQQHGFSTPLSTARTARYARILLTSLAGIALATGMSACSTGSGGDSGRDDGASAGNVNGGGSSAQLAFSYPLNGQDDVYTKTQVAVALRGDVGSDPGLTLVANGSPVATDVTRDANQPNIFRLSAAGDADSVERAALAPNTDYSVQNSDGDTLFTFTTRGFGGRPDTGTFSVRQLTTIGDRNVPFTTFNPIRAQFSRPVDEGSVELCTGNEAIGDNGCTIAVTGPDGNVPGRLTVLGSNMTFDPSSDLGDGTPNSRDADDYDSSDLVAGQTYTVAFNGVQSAFGDSLDSSFSVTPVSTGKDVVQGLTISGGAGDNPLNGSTRNVANIVSQLIGVNNQAASNTPERGGLLTRLAAPSNASRYNGTFPALLPAGQEFDLEPINLQLGGAIDTPVNTGPIHARIINDADVYIAGNTPLAGIETPTLVLLRLDLGIGTDVPEGDPIKALSNGVFNQTVMNVVAAGQAVPQPNGDVKLTTLGSFPASVNRTGQAITDFELELTLPNPLASGTVTVENDQTPPRIIAQYPSACSYTFDTRDTNGDPLFESGEVVGGVDGTTTLSDTEANCIRALNDRRLVNNDDATIGDPDDNDIRIPLPATTYSFPEPRANSLPLNASPSIVFSEPVDPISLADNITLTNVATDNFVPVRLRSEGSSVVINPVVALTPDTQYTVDVASGVTDLAGNGLTGNFPSSTVVSEITFNTEPMVVPTTGGNDYVDISDDLTQRPAVRQTAPFLTVLSPGLPCALQSSDSDPESNFRSGGDTAGRCVGDSPTAEGDFPTPPGLGTEDNPAKLPGFDDAVVQFSAPTSAQIEYPVFKQPANNVISGYFSKPVKASSVSIADGCLIGGNSNSNENATLAVQTMDEAGSCTGVVDGSLRKTETANGLTQGFKFKARNGFKEGQRYWIIICGSADARNGAAGSDCATSQTIKGQNGLALNTNPLSGTGTQVIDNNNSANPRCAADLDVDTVQCFDDNRGQGGPDIVMPFSGTVPTNDFYATTLALPTSDTNGNGFLDNQPSTINSTTPNGENAVVSGAATDEKTPAAVPFDPEFDDSFGRERLHAANIVYSFTTIGLDPSRAGDIGDRRADVGYLGGGAAVAIGTAINGSECSSASDVTFDDGTSVVGNRAPNRCIPVDLLPGGVATITSLAAAGATPTGRVLLRFPYGIDDNSESTGKAQTGYIIPGCTGSDVQGNEYTYRPCFVANLRLTVNGNDGFKSTDGASLAIPQQDINVHVYGPVAFEQDGRLVIATKNANAFALTAYLTVFPGFPALALPAPTFSGSQALQLVGPVLHGGISFDAD